MVDERGNAERIVSGNAAAIAASLDAGRTSEDVAARAAIFLEKQGVLTDLQIEDLRREDSLRHWSLRVHHISDVLKMSFELTVAAIGLAIVTFIGSAIWNAAHDHGIVVEAFQVPPDLAARGLSGQVVASEFLDKIEAMQATTHSDRPAGTYANNWGNDFKVQIPDTGVSVGEFYRYLCQWLGHETYISGEIFHTAKGIAVISRAGEDGSTRFDGTEDNLAALLQSAAEKVYERTQPYRYATYLRDSSRNDGARRVLTDLTENPDRLERAFAWIGLGLIAKNIDGDLRAANADFYKSAAELPDFTYAWSDIADYSENGLGHDEAALTAARKAEGENFEAWMKPEAIPKSRLFLAVDVAEELGDYAEAARLNEKIGVLGGARYGNYFELLAQIDRAHLHDRLARALSKWPTAFSSADMLESRFDVANGLHDWPAIIAIEPIFEVAARKYDVGQDLKTQFEREFHPWLALAKAELGDGNGARSLIGTSPLDCYTCVRFRADIDAKLRRWDAAANWFAEAAKQAPSIPFAYSDWGAMLMAKGDLDGAIAKFELANRKGPHFADPLEMWGEALIAKNRSDLALAKFEEADKYAPNWGRLHLKWGEALWWSGKMEEAKKQFAAASGLDLTSTEKSELVRMRGTHG